MSVGPSAVEIDLVLFAVAVSSFVQGHLLSPLSVSREALACEFTSVPWHRDAVQVHVIDRRRSRGCRRIGLTPTA